MACDDSTGSSSENHLKMGHFGVPKNVPQNHEIRGNYGPTVGSTNFFLKNFELDPMPPLWWLWARSHHGYERDRGRLQFSGYFRDVASLWPVKPPKIHLFPRCTQRRRQGGFLKNHNFAPRPGHKKLLGPRFSEPIPFFD